MLHLVGSMVVASGGGFRSVTASTATAAVLSEDWQRQRVVVRLGATAAWGSRLRVAGMRSWPLQAASIYAILTPSLEFPIPPVLHAIPPLRSSPGPLPSPLPTFTSTSYLHHPNFPFTPSRLTFDLHFRSLGQELNLDSHRLRRLPKQTADSHSGRFFP